MRLSFDEAGDHDVRGIRDFDGFARGKSEPKALLFVASCSPFRERGVYLTNKENLDTQFPVKPIRESVRGQLCFNFSEERLLLCAVIAFGNPDSVTPISLSPR